MGLEIGRAIKNYCNSVLRKMVIFGTTTVALVSLMAFAQLGQVLAEVQIWASPAKSLPLGGGGPTLWEWNTRLEDVSTGSRIRCRFTKGLSASLDFGLRDSSSSASPLQSSWPVCRRATLTVETDVAQTAKLRGDVSLKLGPENKQAMNFVYCGRLPNAKVQMEYDTEESFGKLGCAFQKALFGGKSVLLFSPSYDFRKGEAELHVEADVAPPHLARVESSHGPSSSSSASPIGLKTLRKLPASAAALFCRSALPRSLLSGLSAAATVRRQSCNGDLDCSLQVRHFFNEGRDCFAPMWRSSTRSFEYEWVHLFNCGSSLRAVLEGGKKLAQVQFSDVAASGGKWVASLSFPLSQPLNGDIKLRREFSF